MKPSTNTRPSSPGTCLASVLALLASLAVAACGFRAATPPGFVELPDQDAYDYRATTADGVVIGIRELDHEPEGELGFWVAAIEKQLRERRGYALLETRDVATASGLSGKQLRFGHDQGKDPHLYFVAVFIEEAGLLSGSKLYLIEAGGKKELMEQQAEQLEYAITNFRH